MKKKKGFTLIELIIVVAIIGILAAIAVPKFGDIQNKSKEKADIATAKIIADAITVKIAEGTLASADKGTAAKLILVTSSNSSGIGLQSTPIPSIDKSRNFGYYVDSNNNVLVYVASSDTDLSKKVYPINQNSEEYSISVELGCLNQDYINSKQSNLKVTCRVSIGVQNVPEVQGKYTGITADDFYYTLDGSGNVKVYVGPDTGAKLGSDSNVEEVYPNNN